MRWVRRAGQRQTGGLDEALTSIFDRRSRDEPVDAPVSIYVPRDSAARSVGTDEVADALTKAAERQGRSIRLVRNGSRGMLWLEPLVEVETTSGRIGYGPVAASDVDGLVAAGLFDGAELPQRVGVVDDLPWLATQNRVTFARRAADPLSPTITAIRRSGGLVRALRIPRGVVAGHRLRPARARRGRLPGRHQVEDRARLH